MNESKLYLGAAWYPEQWNPQIVAEDVKLMREIGLNTVRVGEFAWSTFEPTEGQYNTAWLKEALDQAHAHGIRAVLCTPTPTPPAWLLKKYPHLGYEEPDGYRHKHGARQHACYNQPLFRHYSRTITAVLVQAFADHPALVAWQTDNEFRGHQKICVCEACRAGWTEWLTQRYGTVDALNHAWGTQVWSETYADLADVPPPYLLCYYAHNFSLLLNYRRYMADSVVAFQREQVDLIRRYSSIPVTHNSENSVDEWTLTRDLDFASADIYTWYEPPVAAHLRFDNLRGLKPGRRFWTMETGSEGLLFDQLPPVAWLACFAFMNYTSGAEGLCYWPWRQHRGGAEIAHPSVLYACSQPTTAWEPLQQVSEIRGKLEPLLQEYTPAPAAVAFVRSDWNGFYHYSDRAAGLEENFDYHSKVVAQFQALVEIGVWRDVLFDRAPLLPSHHIVFSPYLPYLAPEFLATMDQHLRRGGVWVLGPYSGYVAADHTIPTQAILGDVEAMIGFKTKFMTRISTIEVELQSGLRTQGTMHATVFSPRPEDEVLGLYRDQRFQGEAWGLRCSYGPGSVYVLGSEITDEARRQLYAHILDREGIARIPLPPRVSCCPQKTADGRRAWALSNWDEKPHTIALPQPGQNLLTNTALSDEVILEPFSNAFVAFSA